MSSNTFIRDVPVVVLAGGDGISLDTAGEILPKGMVSIHDVPLLMHIMDRYASSGFRKFVLCAGKNSASIERFVDEIPKFQSKFLSSSNRDDWSVKVVQTGKENRTGSRLSQVRSELVESPHFCLTYSDTYSDINLGELFQWHLEEGKLATLLAINPPVRFKILGFYRDEDRVRGFSNGPILGNDYVNGGFYVFRREVLEMPELSNEPSCTLETTLLDTLVAQEQLVAFKHHGFWQNIDHQRERKRLEVWLNQGLDTKLW